MISKSIIIFHITFHVAYCGEIDVRIGGLFNENTEENAVNIQELAFKYALRLANEKFRESSFHFKDEIKYFNLERNSLAAGKHVCDLMTQGIAAIFGPQFGDSVYVVQDICDLKEIPNIQTRWDPGQVVGSCSVNFYPHPNALIKALISVVQEWGWTKYTLLYDDSDSLLRVSSLLKSNSNKTMDVKLRKIDPDESNFRPLLRKIKEEGDTNFILDCSIEVIDDILKQAQQVGLMGSDHSFIVPNLDFHTLDLEPYKYSGTNITTFRLFTPSAIEDLLSNLTEMMKDKTDISLTTLQLDAVLIYDAVMMYTESIQQVLSVENPEEIGFSVSCDSPEAWQKGYSIINYMKSNFLEGLTGPVKFDHQGFRTWFDLYVLEMVEDGLVEVGKWNKNGDVQIYRYQPPSSEVDRANSLRNVTLNVILSLTAPYGMLVKSHKTLNGNEQYEGFCVDLIKELSAMNNNFNINFIISKDGSSGAPIIDSKKRPPEWSGMIGSILRGEADLACADLTVTREREEVVDFTAVFMNLGIAILYKKPKSDPPGFFSFLSPFKTEVWILVVTAYVTVSLLFFIMARISPYEWTNPFPCVDEPDELENQFTLANSFWFTIGALLQEGSEIAPIANSTRFAAGVWWFFTLIMVACYTANLAAFLTADNPSEDFSNIEELAQQTEIKYGAKSEGSTLQFFNKSSENLHKQIFNYMMVHQDEVLTKSTPQGVEKAVNENYAFLMESSQIEYETERHCSLTQIGKPIDDKGYGIAMRKGSWYLGIFSQSILKIQEDGKLSDLKRKWWKEKYAGSCTVNEKNDAQTLGLMNLGGVFLVLGSGAMVAIFLAIIEMLLYNWSKARQEEVPMAELLKKELKFFLQCRGTTKPANGNTSSDSDKGAVLSYT